MYVKRFVMSDMVKKQKSGLKLFFLLLYFLLLFVLLFYIAHFSSPLITNIPCARPNTEQRRMHLGH